MLGIFDGRRSRAPVRRRQRADFVPAFEGARYCIVKTAPRLPHAAPLRLGRAGERLRGRGSRVPRGFVLSVTLQGAAPPRRGAANAGPAPRRLPRGPGRKDRRRKPALLWPGVAFLRKPSLEPCRALRSKRRAPRARASAGARRRPSAKSSRHKSIANSFRSRNIPLALSPRERFAPARCSK